MEGAPRPLLDGDDLNAVKAENSSHVLLILERLSNQYSAQEVSRISLCPDINSQELFLKTMVLQNL